MSALSARNVGRFRSSGLQGSIEGAAASAWMNGFYASETGFGFRVIILSDEDVDLTEWWWGWQKSPQDNEPNVIDLTCRVDSTSAWAVETVMTVGSGHSHRLDSEWWVNTPSPLHSHILHLESPGLGLILELRIVPGLLGNVPVT